MKVRTLAIPKDAVWPILVALVASQVVTEDDGLETCHFCDAPWEPGRFMDHLPACPVAKAAAILNLDQAEAVDALTGYAQANWGAGRGQTAMTREHALALLGVM